MKQKIKLAWLGLCMAVGCIALTACSGKAEYTVAENMLRAVMNTLLGMGTVFLVLIFISLMISCFKFINIFENRIKAGKVSETEEASVASEAAAAEEEMPADDLELAAVITAAVAAAAGSSTDGLVVRSIRRASGAKWKRA